MSYPPTAVSAECPSDDEWLRLPPHPRILADAGRFAALRAQGDPVSARLVGLLQNDAERKLAAETLSYPATGFLLFPVREAQGRILTLAMQYRLAGDRRCLVRARAELLQLADLPEWRPGHFLDAGEAALAAGIGLDWLHDDLSPPERDRIARAIVNNALVPSLDAVEGVNGWVDGDYNWNPVCNAGLVVGALAVAEREPALARRIVERALRNLPNAEATYAPDGSYPEGPSYWSYGTTFHVILAEALRSAFGASFGLAATPGFLKTADFILQMAGPTGEDYNFADYHRRDSHEPVLLWFARECRRWVQAKKEIEALARLHERVTSGGAPSGGYSRHLALELLWWDNTLSATDEALPRHWTAGGELPVAVLRSAWDDPDATWVAVKGGTADGSHAHMDIGGFVLEAGGVRWAIDLGTEHYDRMRAAQLDLWNYAQDSTRWTSFRTGPDGHNILRFNGARQDVDGKAQIRAFALGKGDVGSIIELSSVYRSQVEEADRRVTLHGDGSVTINDEWVTGSRPVAVSWQWLTQATVRPTKTGFLLRQQGRTLELTVTCETELSVRTEDVSLPQAAQDSPNPGVTRIVVELRTDPYRVGRLAVRAKPAGRRR